MIGQDPRDLLRQYESRWRRELEGVSLVAELELTKQDINTALFCLGTVWNAEFFADRASTRIRRSYPAAFVVAVAGSASMRIIGGRVLPEIFEAMGVRYDGNVGRTFGKTFIACLEELDLPTFPELDTEAAWRYVGRMLLHGGVPLDHLDEFFEVAEMARRWVGDISRHAMQAWLVERADDGRLYAATTAVERFLRYGEDFAADFLDRSLELLDRVRDGDNVDDLNVGLARRYLERAVELRERDELPGAPTRRPSGRPAGSLRPEVRFDPYVLGVHLVLPSVADADGPVTWTVDMEGELERHVARPGRPGLPTPEVEVPLPARVANVEVSRTGQEPTSVRIVDPADPHLVFDGTGRRLDRTARLPREPVWSVHPQQRRVETPPEPEPRVVESHDTVARWPGWVAELVDVREAHQLVIDNGRPYAVSVDDAARLDALAVAPHVRTEAGLEVLAAWPTIRLPTTGTGEADWTVSVTPLDTSTAGITRVITVQDTPVAVDLAELAPSHLTWTEVRIRARGPLGRSLRRDVLVAPGFTVDLTPPVRAIEEAGLSPTRVHLTWNGGQGDPWVLEADETSRAVAVNGSTLIVEPPAVAVQYLGHGTAGGWHHQPLVLDADDVLEAAGSLVVRLHGASTVTLDVLDARGRRVQQVPPDGRRRSDGAVRFDLARLTDTLRDEGSLVLRVDSDVWGGRVARLRPAQLADSVVLQSDRGIIEFHDVRVDGVCVGLYSRLAPTMDPVVLDVVRGDSQLPIPRELLGAGPLRALLRIEDPWVPEPWPGFPSAGVNTLDLEVQADPGSVAALHPLAPYLAGFEDLDDIYHRLGDALIVYDRAHELRADRTGSVIRSHLAPLLADDPCATLDAALDVDLTGPQLARLVVNTSLVTCMVDTPLEVDRTQQLWTRWPAAGLLACGHLQPETPHHQFVLSRCGSDAHDILHGGGQEVLAQPRIDMPAVLDFAPAALAMLRQEAGIAPKFLLDPDSRADDGFALISALQQANGTDPIMRAAREAESLVSYVLDHVLADVGLETVCDGIRARVQGTGWQLLPAASLAAAVAARLAPLSTSPELLFTKQVGMTLTALAGILPRLLAADLVMAELAIQGARA